MAVRFPLSCLPERNASLWHYASHSAAGYPAAKMRYDATVRRINATAASFQG